MRKLLTMLTFLCLSSAAGFAQKIIFTPQWRPQAQFAGYYVAYEMGYYDEEGLDVEIRHLNPNTRMNILSLARAGETDFFTTMSLNAMIAIDAGLDIVNVLQTSQNCALCCVAHKQINDVKNLDGMKIGRWSTGFGENALIAASDEDISVDWIPSIHANNVFIAGGFDATLCYSYNELISLYLSTGALDEDKIFRFSDTEYNYPEDALFVTRKFYEKNPEAVEKFVSASIKGWEFTRLYPDKAVDICMKYILQDNITTNRTHQKMMLEEILRLQRDKVSGKTTYSPISREMFDIMLSKAQNAGFIMGDIQYESFIAQ